jgi:esterase
MRDTMVRNGPVTLPVTRSGSGSQVVFFNGVGATQIAWKRVIARLDSSCESITFDFRGHGKSSPADTYTVEGFLTDAEAVVAAVGSSRPIIVGWSMGADLAVDFAAAHPGSAAGLVLIDGAVPIREPLVEDAVQMRRSLNGVGVRLALRLMRLTPYRYAIPPDAIVDLAIEVDQQRQHVLRLFGHKRLRDSDLRWRETRRRSSSLSAPCAFFARKTPSSCRAKPKVGRTVAPSR